jgi:hypothetical protein
MVNKGRDSSEKENSTYIYPSVYIVKDITCTVYYWYSVQNYSTDSAVQLCSIVADIYTRTVRGGGEWVTKRATNWVDLQRRHMPFAPRDPPFLKMTVCTVYCIDTVATTGGFSYMQQAKRLPVVNYSEMDN